MSDHEEEVWVPISQREEWKDVERIPQDDGPNPVVPIAYTSEFTEVMDYFRATVARDERSPRALQLTAEVIALNPGNYTVWHFRRLVLEALGNDLNSELQFVTQIAEENAKNYQIWHHRRWLAEKRGPAGRDDELEFTRLILKEDAKNYHAWSHRQWVLQALGGWETELDFCKQLLDEDVYNNSAWNQRYFVISNSPTMGGLAARNSEIHYCCEAIRLSPNNESSWRYLTGLFNDDKNALVECTEAVKLCMEELAQDKTCVHALNFLLELLRCGFHPTSDDCRLLDIPSDGFQPEDVARRVCERLEVVDSMRCNYWAWRKYSLDFVRARIKYMKQVELTKKVREACSTSTWSVYVRTYASQVGLPNDIALECLIRLPKLVQLQVRSVSKCWNELLSSEEFHTFRTLHNYVDDWLLLVLNNNSSCPSLLAYDFQTSMSHRIEVPTELQEHLRYFGVCCAGYGHLSFFVGGSTSSPENLDLYNHGDLSIFNVATSSWRKGASMNSGRSYFASGFIGGYFYVAGGCDNERTGEVYDTETDSWRYIAPMPFAFRTIESFTVFKGRLYMKGIVNGVRKVLIYDPGVDAWEEPREFENGMKEGEFVATKENLYLINRDGYIGRYGKEWSKVGSVSRYFMPFMSSCWGGLQSMYFGKDLFLIKSSGEDDLMDLRCSKHLHKAVLAAFLQCQSLILSM